MSAEQVRQELIERGYVEHPEAYDVLDGGGFIEPKVIYDLRPGMRVCHVGEQYPEAREDGTATVLHVMVKDPSAWARKYRQPDIEVVVRRDKEVLGHTVTNWAHYHCVNARNQPEEP